MADALGNILRTVGKAGELWTYGPMAVREEQRREKQAEEAEKYRQTQEERLKAQSESRIQSEKARQAYWQSRAGQTGTTKDLTPAQKAQLFTAIGGLVNGGALTEGQANVALSEYGMKWPQEPPEVPASTPGALSNLPPAISQSMPSPRLPTQPGDIWAQAPMRTTGFGGSAFSQLATPLATGQSLTGEQVPPEYKRLGVTQYRAPTTGTNPYPDYPDAFLENGVWKVIREGKKYRIED